MDEKLPSRWTIACLAKPVPQRSVVRARHQWKRSSSDQPTFAGTGTALTRANRGFIGHGHDLHVRGVGRRRVHLRLVIARLGDGQISSDRRQQRQVDSLVIVAIERRWVDR